ncbi:MAG: tetratricopeptide repeat protein [Thermoguttaceae bacterium]|nr:tetratricopeptide repeat protein [Thermoguttaceae bacterium]
MSDSSGPLQPRSSQFLNGKTVRIFGPLQSMPQRDAIKLIREHGGEILPNSGPSESVPADWIIIGENQNVFNDALSKETPEWLTDQLREDIECGLTHIATETQLLQRLFPSDDQSKDLTALYTPMMLAELLHVTVSDVRRWYQRGLIAPVRVIQRLPYFNLEEVFSARRLSQLLQNGVKHPSIEKKMRALRKLNPSVLPMLSGNDLVIQGKNVFLRQNDRLLESSGQMVLDFDGLDDEKEDALDPQAIDQLPGRVEDFTRFNSETGRDDLLLFDDWDEQEEAGEGETGEDEAPKKDSPWIRSAAVLDHMNEREEERISIERMRAGAFALEEAGKLAEAEEMWRNVLLAAGANAEDAFQLGDLLLREGHLEAARERFSMAIEMDEDFVEARASLGCVLGELGETRLAIAALQGAIAYHPDYAEAYYHLARFLEIDGQKEKACESYKKFLELVKEKESFWGKEAAKRVEELENH